MIPAREDREFFIYAAKVYINEAARRRQNRAFSFTLLDWAANARKRAMTASRPKAQKVLL